MRTSPGQVVAMTISVALLSLGGIAVPGTVAGASSGHATSISPVVDQSFTSADNSSSLINEGARFVAQIFTAGRTGLLTGVSVDVLDCCNSPYALDVALRTVGPTGAPTDTVLAEERTDSCCPRLSQIVTFAQPVRVLAGTQYAIVVSYPDAPFANGGNAQGAWIGSNTDGYPGGRALFYYTGPPVGPGWVESGPSHDVNFRTYVQALPPTPTTIRACMRSGWQTVADEAGVPFRNQGQCIRFVEHHKRSSSAPA